MDGSQVTREDREDSRKNWLGPIAAIAALLALSTAMFFALRPMAGSPNVEQTAQQGDLDCETTWSEACASASVASHRDEVQLRVPNPVTKSASGAKGKNANGALASQRTSELRVLADCTDKNALDQLEECRDVTEEYKAAAAKRDGSDAAADAGVAAAGAAGATMATQEAVEEEALADEALADAKQAEGDSTEVESDSTDVAGGEMLAAGAAAGGAAAGDGDDDWIGPLVYAFGTVPMLIAGSNGGSVGAGFVGSPAGNPPGGDPRGGTPSGDDPTGGNSSPPSAPPPPGGGGDDGGGGGGGGDDGGGGGTGGTGGGGGGTPTSGTPEPVTTTLMGLGLLGWAGAKARRRMRGDLEDGDEA